MSDSHYYSTPNYNINQYQAQYQHIDQHSQMTSNNFQFNSRFNQPMQNQYDQRSNFTRPRYYSSNRPEYNNPRSHPYPRYRHNSSQYQRNNQRRKPENEGKNNIERYYQPSMLEDPWLSFEKTKVDNSSTTEETK